jgi:hypothetical protein
VKDSAIRQLLLVTGLVMYVTVSSRAQAESPSRPDISRTESDRAAPDAQPGINRVAIAQPTRPTLAATLGYGYTEPQGASDGSHHRFSTRLAGAFSVAPWLNIGAMTDARYDLHPHDSGAIMDGALALRLSTAMKDSRMGAELKGWVPGSEKLTSTFKAFSLDARGLFAQRIGVSTLAASLGYRFDRSAKVGGSAPRLSYADRLSIGLSDFDAALIGIGAIVPFGSTSLLVEFSGDLLIGKRAPSVLKSPLRSSVGVRQVLSSRLSADVLLDWSLSGRPGVSPDAPLIPIEPRVTVLAGIRYRFEGPEQPSPVTPTIFPEPPKTTAKEPEPPVAPTPTDAVLEVVVIDDQHQPVPDAKLRMLVAGVERPMNRDEAGHFRDEHTPIGQVELTIEAVGFEPVKRTVAVQVGAPQKIEIQLTSLPPPSQVRGVVRSFGGKGLVARIHIDPIGSDSTTDSSGAFQLDVPPGSYEVSIEAPGYEPQHRKVQVEPLGVVIVNADLVKKR